MILVNKWLSDNYNEIINIAKNVMRNDKEYRDVAHEVIISFMNNKKALTLITNGEALKYIAGMIHLSAYSKTSPYGYKKEINNELINLEDIEYRIAYEEIDYDENIDILLTKIETILEEKKDIKLWFNITLFRKWLECNNFSKLSRETNIPRKTISRSVKEAINYIKKRVEDDI